MTIKCFNCGNDNATKKCNRCKSVWFCSKECQLAKWKEHKKDCKSCENVISEVTEGYNVPKETYQPKDLKNPSESTEDLIWPSIEEKEKFYIRINNLQTSYKAKFLTAIESYTITCNFLNKLFNTQIDYLYKNIVDDKYKDILQATVVCLKDSEAEWRILQAHSSEMSKIFKDKTDTDWNMTLYAFYDQMYLETTNYRALICLGLSHCYYFLKFVNTDEKLIKDFNDYYSAHKDLALLYKSKLTDIHYIQKIEKAQCNTENTIKLYESKHKLLNKYV
jgi:hypothetical protein